MTEQKQKTLANEGKERTIRNCVFWFVVVYAAILTFLFVNAEIKLVNAQSELASVKAIIATQQAMTSESANDVLEPEFEEISEYVEEENVVEEENTEVEETYAEE